MKKIIFYSITACLLFAAQSFQSASAKSVSIPLPMSKPAEAVKAEILIQRLNEINAIDKSTLKSGEKKILRREVRSIQKKLQDLGGGVYLSFGAILIILLILILVF